ncbi:MAG: TRAP transporter small permease [Anaerolineae bacterium]|nr:TRAP transporter small permease [Anaerolineae bacterium]
MLKTIDRFNAFCGWFAAWLLLATGIALAYEVVARYLFGSPTIWVEEVSRLVLLWATYLGAATVLARRELITVSVITASVPAALRRASELLSLVVIAAFCVYAIRSGTQLLVEAVVQKRTSASMLGMPLWGMSAAVPVGLALLVLQCGVEFAKLLRAPQSGNPTK